MARVAGMRSPSAYTPYTMAVIMSAASVHVHTTIDRPSFSASVCTNSPVDVSTTLSISPNPATIFADEPCTAPAPSVVHSPGRTRRATNRLRELGWRGRVDEPLLAWPA